MNKRKVEYLIPYAIQCIEEDKQLCKEGKVPSEFNGYISSFGANIIQSGILATVTFFSNVNSNTNEERCKVPELIFNILSKSKTIKTDTKKLTEYLIEENKKGKDYLRKAKNEVINAAIALKLGMRVFEFVNGDNSEKGSEKDSDDGEVEKAKEKPIKLIIKSLKKAGINLDDKVKLEKCEKEFKDLSDKIDKRTNLLRILDFIDKYEYISKITYYYLIDEKSDNADFVNYIKNEKVKKSEENKLKNKIPVMIENFLTFIPLLKLNPNEVKGNLSYLYYKDYFDDLITKNFSENKDYENYYFDIKNEQLIYRSKREKLKSIDMVNEKNESFTLKTIYPGLLIGSGYNHQISKDGEFKLGLEFDFITGLPIINGSSIKGVLRSVFYIDDDKNNEDRLNYINEIIKICIDDQLVNKIEKNELNMTDFEKLTSEIFDGTRDKGVLNIYERDIFFNAVIDLNQTKAEFILGEDFITPHKSPLKNPIPLKFLKVMPEVAWRFEFDLKDGILSIDQKRELFKAIIKDLGIGAKTNVGYGALVDIDNKDSGDNDNYINDFVFSDDQSELTDDMLLSLKNHFEK